MAKQRGSNQVTDLVTYTSAENITVLPPNSGVVGQFLEETRNMFKARAMRMRSLLRKIDESGQRMEALLRTALGKAEAAEAVLQHQFSKEGLLPEAHCEED